MKTFFIGLGVGMLLSSLLLGIYIYIQKEKMNQISFDKTYYKKISETLGYQLNSYAKNEKELKDKLSKAEKDLINSGEVIQAQNETLLYYQTHSSGQSTTPIIQDGLFSYPFDDKTHYGKIDIYSKYKPERVGWDITDYPMTATLRWTITNKKIIINSDNPNLSITNNEYSIAPPKWYSNLHGGLNLLYTDSVYIGVIGGYKNWRINPLYSPVTKAGGLGVAYEF